MINPSGNTVGSLTATQHAVMVGSLLGDGTLRKQGTRTNALFEVNHAWQHKEYVDWKYGYFQSYILTVPRRRLGNGKRVAYRFTTQSLPIFTNYYRWFYQNRKKRVPEDLVLDPLTLAVWYMDDGNKSRSACYLNTQQFSIDEQRFLQSLLLKTFRVDSTLNRDKKYSRIRITTASTRVLENMIKDFVIPCMQYKLHDDPVTTDPKGEALIYRSNTPTLVTPT